MTNHDVVCTDYETRERQVVRGGIGQPSDQITGIVAGPLKSIAVAKCSCGVVWELEFDPGGADKERADRARDEFVSAHLLGARCVYP